MLDIAFIHPPSAFEKRDRPLAGVFPAETGTDSWFRHAPLGLSTMAQKLRAAGFTATILNLAKACSDAVIAGRPLSDAEIDARLLGLPARCYGISLHWAVHTPGALALAARLRRLHPGAVIVLGGLTASYFADEALALEPALTGVLRGECESAIISLARAARAPRFEPRDVANLVWCERAKSGEVRALHRNPFLAPDLSPVDWLDMAVYERGSEPDSLVIPILRGCIEDCTFCGGSRSAYGDWFERPSPQGTDPDQVLDHLRRGAALGRPVAFLAGDLRGMGERRASRLLDALAHEELPIEIQNELYFEADRSWLERLARATRKAGARLSLSPESADRAVRSAVSSGKSYDNQTIIETVLACADLGLKLSLCFFFALPGQTRESILADLDFAEEAASLAPESTAFMIEPMLFVDPGSRLFREPERHGMTILWRTLAEIRAGLLRPHWSESIGYETRWLPRGDMARTILDVFERTSRVRLALGHETLAQHLHVSASVEGQRRVLEALSALGRAPTDADVRAAALRHLPPAARADNNVKDYNHHARLAAQGLAPSAALPQTTAILLGSGAPHARAAEALSHGAVFADDAATPAIGAALAPALEAALLALGAACEPPLEPAFIRGLARYEGALHRSRRQGEVLAKDLGLARAFAAAAAPGGYAEGLVRGEGAAPLAGEEGRGASPGGVALATATTSSSDVGYTAKDRAALARLQVARCASVTAPLRVAREGAIVACEFPFHDLEERGLANVRARPGRYAVVLGPAGRMALEGEAAALALAIAGAGPQGITATAALGGHVPADEVRALERFLESLARTGAIEGAAVLSSSS